MNKCKTIQNEIVFSGIGLHSGKMVNMKLVPSNDGGIVFKRVDKKENNIVKGLFSNVIDTKLGTTIGNGVEKVATIEHLMASLWACDIDNIIIEIDNQETPIMDGSAIEFIKKIKEAGIKELNTERKYLKVEKEIEYIDGDKSIKIIPDDKFSIDMTVDFNYGGIGKQHYVFDGNQENFIKNIAIARTFCNQVEIDYMRQLGLARGGSMDNAMIFDNNGLVNEGGFRTDFEVVKHKILDCVGDLFTSGYYIKGKVIANKTGHTLNNLFVRKLLS